MPGPPIGSVSNNGDQRQRTCSEPFSMTGLFRKDDDSQVPTSLSISGLTDISVDSGEPAGPGRLEPKAIARVFFSLGIEKDISRAARLG